MEFEKCNLVMLLGVVGIIAVALCQLEKELGFNHLFHEKIVETKLFYIR